MTTHSTAPPGRASRRRDTPDLLDKPAFEALESEAHFDHVLFDAEQFGMGGLSGSEEEADFLGLPGLLEPEQVQTLLRERQHEQLRRSGKKSNRSNGAAEAPLAAHRALAATRKELNSLVSAYARKTGQPHARVHVDLRTTCGGPALEEATSEQVQARIARIREWFVGRR